MKNISRARNLEALRDRLDQLERSGGVGRCAAATQAPCGEAGEWPWDILRPGLHDLYARTAADAPALLGFTLCLALQTARGRPIIWAIDRATRRETGDPYGPGLVDLGLDLNHLILVRVKDAQALLAVGEDAARSPAVGAVVLSGWGEAKAFSLTASRRLALACQTSGGSVFLARSGADPAPSAADTRWSVGAALSRALEAEAPGLPTFSARLLRRRRGDGINDIWCVEWDRDGRSFRKQATVSGSVVPVGAQRPGAPRERRAA